MRREYHYYEDMCITICCIWQPCTWSTPPHTTICCICQPCTWSTPPHTTICVSCQNDMRRSGILCSILRPLLRRYTTYHYSPVRSQPNYWKRFIALVLCVRVVASSWGISCVGGTVQAILNSLSPAAVGGTVQAILNSLSPAAGFPRYQPLGHLKCLISSGTPE